MEFNSIKIYGEGPSPDCPQDGGFCHKYDKYGIASAAATYNGKDMHIDSASPLPPHKIKSIASWGGKVVYKNMEFRDFKSVTKEGKKNRIF